MGKRGTLRWGGGGDSGRFTLRILWPRSATYLRPHEHNTARTVLARCDKNGRRSARGGGSILGLLYSVASSELSARNAGLLNVAEAPAPSAEPELPVPARVVTASVPVTNLRIWWLPWSATYLPY